MSDAAYAGLLNSLRTELQTAKTSEPFLRLTEAKDEVCARYGKIFDPKRIGELTVEEFKSFLDFKNNRHWTGLHRTVGRAVGDMPRLQKAIALLLDESVSLPERFEGATTHTGIGKAVASAILMVVFPDRYGVWNGRSETVIKKLGLWPRAKSPGERYEKLNALLTSISRDLPLDLWSLDALWWFLDQKQLATPSANLSELFEEILSLQSEWSDRATPAMNRRGELIRDHITRRLRTFLSERYQGSIELSAEGRDGTGRKTRVPWARIYNPQLSPSAMQGWYVVFLFAADGKAVYLSLNQGTTEMKNGSFVPRDRKELAERVGRARLILGDDMPAVGLSSISLADKGNLGEGYEAGNVVAFRYEADSIPDSDDLLEDLTTQLGLLETLYEQEAVSTRAYLLVWNPSQYPWNDISAAAENVPVGDKWSTISKQIKPGDRLFLMRVHSEPKGIVAAAHAISRTFSAPHWGDESKNATYVTLQWETILPPPSKQPLPLATLRSLDPDFVWTPNGSGISIPRATAIQLEAAWLDHIRSSMREQEDERRLVLLGTSRELTNNQAQRIASAIRDRGGWASWWSFPIREEYREQLTKPFDLFLNTGGDRIEYKLTVADYVTQAGNSGIESPWPTLTDGDVVGKTSMGPAQSEVFKTWFRATKIEKLEPALTRADFQPAEGWRETALLNQASFGYAYRRNGSFAQAPLLDLRAIHEDFVKTANAAGLRFGERSDEVIRTFLVSLATKRFVILTGLSGSGKTQIALKFGEWLGHDRYHLAPVRPDWTGGDALFGFEDALQPAVDGRRAWVVTDILRFVLRAVRDPLRPYLLILDEMNLAHVERYFADVLSGMESGKPVVPNIFPDQNGEWRVPKQDDRLIPFPLNLFVVGTVNVDETTYMFSPKVLDRANTIEFRVQTDELDIWAKRPVQANPTADHIARGFLEIATDDDWRHQQSTIGTKHVFEHLISLHKILAEAGFEFGHRVLFEVIRFTELYELAGATDYRPSLDLQVLQKLLPKLHGSRRKLEPLLNALGHFTHTLTQAEGFEAAASFQPLNVSKDAAELPRSFEKIQRMLRSLHANQFASFVE